MVELSAGTVLVVALAAVGAASLLVTWLADRAVIRALQTPPAPLPSDDGPASDSLLPGISVLKPVKGLDDGLYDNLASIARQDYPRLEILVGAVDAADPALAVARRVAADHPAVRMRVVICPEDGGLNPKVTLLRALSARARYDHVLISDSNVRVDACYLSATARELAGPGVALVTNPIVGIGEQSLGSLFENLHLVTYVARAIAFAAAHLGRACVVGKSMLFRRSDLARIGGWALVRDVLAEDYVIGHAFERAGRRIAVSPQVARTYNQSWPVDRFINRHLRWGQMRRRVSLIAYATEPVFNPHALFVTLMLASLATHTAAGLMVPAALLGMTARLVADRSLLQRVRGGEPPSMPTMLLGIGKDLLVLGIWVIAGYRRTVDWRGNLFVLRAGTRLERPRLPRHHGPPSPAPAMKEAT